MKSYRSQIKLVTSKLHRDISLHGPDYFSNTEAVTKTKPIPITLLRRDGCFMGRCAEGKSSPAGFQVGAGSQVFWGAACYCPEGDSWPDPHFPSSQQIPPSDQRSHAPFKLPLRIFTKSVIVTTIIVIL